jgi:hypothetical protein
MINGLARTRAFEGGIVVTTRLTQTHRPILCISKPTLCMRQPVPGCISRSSGCMNRFSGCAS